MTASDSFDAKLVGERLRVARTAAGMTQEAAASGVNVARTTIVAIERGDRRVRSSELLELARLYGTSVNALLRPTAIHVEVPAPSFRHSSASKDARDAAVRELLRLATAYVELERAVHRPLRTIVAPEYPTGRGALLPQAEDVAGQLRALLGMGYAPVSDVLHVAELQLGLRVFLRPLASRVAGVYAFDPQLGGCVLVNSQHPAPRRAWTIAHEIGHYMTERHAPEIVTTDGSHDSFADFFAGCFLIPPAALRRRFGELAASGAKFSPRDLILLAQEYRTSVEAMCRWLERLTLLPKQTYDALRQRGLNATVVESVVGTHDRELPPTVPPRLLTIAAEAYFQGLVTEGQLVEMLAIDRVSLRVLLDGMPDDAFDE